MNTAKGYNQEGGKKKEKKKKKAKCKLEIEIQQSTKVNKKFH